MNNYYKMNYDYLNSLKPKHIVFYLVLTINIIMILLFIIILSDM